MTIGEIRELSKLNKTKFCQRYKIPYRTYMDWESGRTTPPIYLIKMLERLVHIDFCTENCTETK